MFTGSLVALITPFKNGSVDEKGFEKFVAWQIEEGTDGLVPCGTTGESPTLSMEEHKRVIDICISAAKGSGVPVIAGTGSNSTAHAIAASHAAQAAGADGLLVVTPYYNKPTQEGLYRHFRAIADAVPLPIVVYNIPGRTGCDMSVETLVRLVAAEPRIVGVKEATGSVARAQEVVHRLGDRIAVLSGEDALNLPIYAVGGRGCISVVSNVVPGLVAGAYDAVTVGDLLKARELHQQTLRLTEALFVETNPIPVKAALAMMGMIGTDIRPPLYAMSGSARERLRAVLSEHGLV
jgi:4-hydroxy-tetrahydrodipicolinate synthase